MHLFVVPGASWLQAIHARLSCVVHEHRRNMDRDVVVKAALTAAFGEHTALPAG
jgi:hypothetical protein